MAFKYIESCKVDATVTPFVFTVVCYVNSERDFIDLIIIIFKNHLDTK